MEKGKERESLPSPRKQQQMEATGAGNFTDVVQMKTPLSSGLGFEGRILSAVIKSGAEG